MRQEGRGLAGRGGARLGSASSPSYPERSLHVGEGGGTPSNVRAVNPVAAVPLRHRDVLVVQVGTETQIVPVLPVDGAGVVESVVIVVVVHAVPL